MTAPDASAPQQAARQREYDRWLTGWSLSGAFMRWAMGGGGVFAVNSPLSRLPENLALDPDMRILDIGCGRASVLRLLNERVRFERRPVGVDFSAAALGLARRDEHRAGRPSELARASATSLPFADGAFDVVLCGYVLKHLDDDKARRCFVELRRVLAGGGLAVIWEFAPTGNPRLDGFNAWVLSRGVASPRLRSTVALRALAQQAGFEFHRDAGLRPFLLPPIPRASVLAGRPPEGWQPPP